MEVTMAGSLVVILLLRKIGDSDGLTWHMRVCGVVRSLWESLCVQFKGSLVRQPPTSFSYPYSNQNPFVPADAPSGLSQDLAVLAPGLMVSTRTNTLFETTHPCYNG